MKTIKIEKYMDIEEATTWMNENKNEILFNHEDLTIDMSEIGAIPAIITGFLIDIIRHYRKNRIKLEIVPPIACFMNTIFNEIERGFENVK